MANRTRPIRIEFCVSENEHRIIKSKMAQLGTNNMGAYLRKMAIDGYIIKVDYTEEACRRCQPCSVKYQSDLPPYQFKGKPL